MSIPITITSENEQCRKAESMFYRTWTFEDKQYYLRCCDFIGVNMLPNLSIYDKRTIIFRAHSKHKLQLFSNRKDILKIKCLNCDNQELFDCCPSTTPFVNNKCLQCGDVVHFSPYIFDNINNFTIDTVDSDEFEYIIYSSFDDRCRRISDTHVKKWTYENEQYYRRCCEYMGFNSLTTRSVNKKYQIIDQAHKEHAYKLFAQRKNLPKVMCINCNNPDLLVDNKCSQCGDEVYFKISAIDFYGEKYDKKFTIDTIDSDDAIKICIHSEFNWSLHLLSENGH